MSALENEVIEKFHRLDKDAQKRVRERIMHDTDADIKTAATFDYAAWFRDIEALRDAIRASHRNSLPPMDIVGILREFRDGEDE